MKHEPYEHGPTVEAWLKEPSWLPETDLARVSNLVHQTPQRRSWLSFPGLERSRLMISATSMVAGAAAVALITGGLLLNGLAPPPPTEPRPAAVAGSATAEATEPAVAVAAAQESSASNEHSINITLPDPLPDGVTGGEIDTAEGPARWALTEVDTGLVPRAGAVLPWGDGLAVWETQSKRPDGGVGTLWVTMDGTSWRSEALPKDFRKHPSADPSTWTTHLSGAYFLHEPRTGKLWRRGDNGEWTRLDTSAVDQARPGGWFVHGPHLLQPYVVDDDLVFRASYLYQLPRNGLGIEGGPQTNRMHHLEKNRYALCPAANAECSAKEAAVILRFKAAEGGLVVRDDRTGERYGLLKGAKPSELYEGNNRMQWHTFVLDGDKLVPVEARRDPAETVEEPAPAGLPDGVHPWRTDAGWVAVSWPERLSDDPDWEPGSWWMYMAGEWVDLAESGFPDLLPYATSWREGGVGNTTLLWFDDHENGTSSLWVVTAPEGS